MISADSKVGAAGPQSGSYVAVDTWANLQTYATAAYANTRLRCTNVGANGSDMIVASTGRIVPINGTVFLDSLCLPCILAPSITGTTDGAITYGTSLLTTYLRAFVYFEANVVNASQPAGFYYTVASSATTATVYNNTYTPANGVHPTAPTTLVPFSGAVPGGAGTTGIITYFSTLVPGKLLGEFGSFISAAMFEQNNNANAKTARITFGGAGACTHSLASSVVANGAHVIKNTNTDRQRTAATYNNTTSSAAYGFPLNVDTESDVTVLYTLQKTTATDWVIAQGLLVTAEVRV